MVIGIPTTLLTALSPDQHCTYFPDTLYMTLLPAFQSVFFLRCLYSTLQNLALHRTSSASSLSASNRHVGLFLRIVGLHFGGRCVEISQAIAR